MRPLLVGRPIWEPTAFQRAPSKWATSLSVATHSVPFGVSANCHGVPVGSPSTRLNPCQCPSLRSATPPNVNPTHNPPSRGGKAEFRLNDESLGSWGSSMRSNAIPSNRNNPLGPAIHRYPSLVCARATAPPKGAPWLGPQAVWCSSLIVRSGLSAAAQTLQRKAAIASQPLLQSANTSGQPPIYQCGPGLPRPVLAGGSPSTTWTMGPLVWGYKDSCITSSVAPGVSMLLTCA